MFKNPVYLKACIFLCGAIIGSFLNVCIYRLPILKSIIRPFRSICPKCREKIPFYNNIPILSYIVLIGKCSGCDKRISLRYFFVEVAGGAFALYIFMRFGLTWLSLVSYMFICCLIIATFTDIENRVIPDSITIPGIVFFFLSSFFVPGMDFKDSLLGLLLGGGILYVIAFIYALIAGRTGIGGGDIKLLAMIGAFIGWKGTLFVIFSASLSGAVIGFLIFLIRKQNFRQAIPFGPFLGISSILYIFHGDIIIRWYFQFFSELSAILNISA